MKIIGITGGVGSGKSELLKYIEAHYSARVLRSDEAAHEVSLVPGGLVYDELAALLEKNQKENAGELLNADGTINRKEMAARIFQSPELREKVNALVHPAVRIYIDDAIRKEREKGTTAYFFLEAALLIECGYKKVVDEMWYVYTDPAVRRERLKKSRGYSDAKIDAIMQSQLSDAEFRKNADVVIDNSGDLSAAYRQIDAQLSK